MFRTVHAGLAVMVLVAGASSVAGCGGVDGKSGHFPGTVVYDSPADDYHFHLLEPPWIPLTVLGETLFVIPATLEITAIPTEQDALYTLRIERQHGGPQALFDGQYQTLINVALSGSVKVRDGTLDVAWQEGPDRYRRDAFIAGATADVTYRMTFTSRNRLADDPLILAMILSFEPRSSEAAHVASP